MKWKYALEDNVGLASFLSYHFSLDLWEMGLIMDMPEILRVLLQSVQAKQHNSMIDGIFGVERSMEAGF